MRNINTIENKLQTFRNQEEEILNEIKTYRLRTEQIPNSVFKKRDELNIKISLLKWVLNM